MLSEVARTDRRAPWMSPEERAAMVAAAAHDLQSVRDHRGCDDAYGWRHGVAQGSDWVLQLALNPARERGQLDEILSVRATGQTLSCKIAGRTAPVWAAPRGKLPCTCYQ